ncbi:MAG: nucleotidyltransferase domain-containing protein [Candidatus Micrarchaeia archaeon]
MLERLIKSRTAVNVIGVALFHDGLHLREIARRAGTAPSQAKRELDALVALGVLGKEKKGNICIYHQRKECPIFGDLRNLYLKTDGAVGEVCARLLKVDGISRAFIYGSMAGGAFGERSDVDVMVVGTADDGVLSQAMFEAQKRTGREINYILWGEKDYAQKAKERGAFFKSVAAGKKIWLVGEKVGFG